MRRMLMCAVMAFGLGMAVPAQAANEIMTVGHVAPDFTLPTLTGGQMSLSSLKGHSVILKFFASWCHNCQGEMPELVKVSTAYAGRVDVLAINLTSSEASPAVVRRFVTKYGLQGPVLLDRTGVVTARYLVNAIPMTVVIAKDGRVVAAVRGQQTAKTLTSLFEDAVTGRSFVA